MSMADESAARDFSSLADPVAPSVTQPDIHIQETPQVQPVATPASHVAISAFERTLMVTLGIVLVSLCTMIVSSKIAVSSAQQHLQDIGQSVTALQLQNTNYKQEINELMQSNHLNDVAARDGLSLNEANIRNVK